MNDWFPHRARRWSHVAALLGCGLLAAGVPLALEWMWPRLLEPVELWTVDVRFRLRPALPVADPAPEDGKSGVLATIDYDNRAAQEHGLGRWPWDRRVHAQVIRWLREWGARAVVMDLVFEHPSRGPGEDQALIAASREAGNVFYPLLIHLGQETEGSPPIESRFLIRADAAAYRGLPAADAWSLPLPGLVEAAAGLGHIRRTVDPADGILRRIPAVYRVANGFVPALSLAAAFHHLGVDLTSVQIERWVGQGGQALWLRIGVNTGIVTVGNLGTEYLWDYTVVGPEVNKAQRLESAADPGGVLLSGRTYRLARARSLLPEELPAVTRELKGIGAESDLYAVSLELVARLATALPAIEFADRRQAGWPRWMARRRMPLAEEAKPWL